MTRVVAGGRGSRPFQIWLAAAVLLLAPIVVHGAQKGPEQSAELHFVVIRQEDGKPVRNASVVLHQFDKNGRQRNDGYQLKTDHEGKASVDGIAYGKLRVQVIAHGLQTYGEDYDIKQPTMEFTIELKPPKPQISIY
ncbi:MAG: hypothetical protein ABSD96_18165 [Candidatus Korobacteraceae bacterium]|jgi:hypothetical protein